MRGDIKLLGIWADLFFGPPPHAWGHHEALVLVYLLTHRSTPTCVGTSRVRPSPARAFEVHPHMRGDILMLAISPVTGHGPPPHAWGHLRGMDSERVGIRSTPTCVGTSARSAGISADAPVHPHMRGDIAEWAAGHLKDSGPPPHAWGHPTTAIPQRHVCRSTPTCVGTSLSNWLSSHDFPS